MTVNEYLPKQYNGPIINALATAIENEFKDADAVEDYLHGLSIRTAQETELENIGLILGYPRPLVPEGMNSEGLFEFGYLPITEDESIGFSDTESTTNVGGKFASTEPSSGDYLNLSFYRMMLEWIAYIKRYGLTLYAIDKITSVISNDFELSWNEIGDVIIQFGSNIGARSLWLITNLFARFAVLPQVIIRNGGSGE